MAGSPEAFQSNAFQNNAFQTGDGGGTPEPEVTTGGWLTAEQAAQQLREIRRQEKQEKERSA